jgi:Tol biopolymer transport system component
VNEATSQRRALRINGGIAALTEALSDRQREAASRGERGSCLTCRFAVSAYLVAVVVGAVFLLERPAPGYVVTESASVDSMGRQSNNLSQYASMSADGRYVAFQSAATNLVEGDTNNLQDVFVHDRFTGATERVSVNSSGQEVLFGYLGSRDAAISADGRVVAFTSDAADLVQGTTNVWWDVFVHDRMTGVTARVSVDSSGNEGDGSSGGGSLSADGRYAAFDSLASNLVAADTNSVRDVLVHDRVSGKTERVSVSSAGTEGNEQSFSASISWDGRYVAFSSEASNLVAADTNGAADVFVHDRMTGATERVSVDNLGYEGNRGSGSGVLSSDGRYVGFVSSASNLSPGDDNETADIFLRDRLNRTTQRLRSGGLWSMSADARYFAFSSLDVFVYDRLTQRTYVASADSDGNPGDWFSSNPAISADGSAVAFESRASNFGIEGSFNDIFVATSAMPDVCIGDCNRDGQVTVDELVTGVDIALATLTLETCPQFNSDAGGTVTIDELLQAVGVALNGCNLADSDVIPYRLMSDSAIVPPQSGTRPTIEGLNGTLVVVPAKPVPPNTIFDYAITRIRFRSGAFFGTEYAVDGSKGRISATTLDPTQPLLAEATVTINGVPVQLEGRGSADTFTADPHPRLIGVKMSGGGYEITLYASPEL